MGSPLQKKPTAGLCLTSTARHIVLLALCWTSWSFADDNELLPMTSVGRDMRVAEVQQRVNSTTSSTDKLYTGEQAKVVIPRVNIAHVNVSAKYFFLDDKLVQVNLSTGIISEAAAASAFDKIARVMIKANGLVQDHDGQNDKGNIQKSLNWDSATHQDWLLMLPVTHGRSMVTFGRKFKPLSAELGADE
ncbi:MAG: hypothetical protein CR974_00260 [Gammaproteobacteria bacterium]|nr:MAG: hypothetical protein CR974_00260 [Gammaproteobacteria bacterium]